MLAAALVLSVQLAAPPSAHAAEVEAEEHVALREGRRVSLLEKRPAAEPDDGVRAVLFLPGASASSRAAWDLDLRDYSVLDAFARRGRHAFAVDPLGYGASDDPAPDDPGGAASAVRDLHAAVELVRELRGVEKVDLVGWSWGAQVAGRYAQLHPEATGRVVLYGFTWRERIPEEAFEEGRLDAAWRPVTEEQARADFVDGCHELDVPAAFAAACRKHDDAVPMGALRDYVRELPLVDPAELEVPCLAIYGRFELEPPPDAPAGLAAHLERRRADAEAFHAALPDGRLEVVPGGGHAVHLERGREEWRERVLAFLERG